jgi:hypothetical protein
MTSGAGGLAAVMSSHVSWGLYTQTFPLPLQTGQILSERIAFGSRPVPLQKAHLTKRVFSLLLGISPSAILIIFKKSGGCPQLNLIGSNAAERTRFGSTIKRTLFNREVPPAEP